MKAAAILGSGFGLYGYLPALLQAGAEQVFLPERYREKFSGRTELERFAGQIEWVEDEHAALGKADCVVIALKPDLQEQWARACMQYEHITQLLLEKPLAPTPDMSLALFNALLQAGKNVRIGYLFRFTAWGQALIVALQDRPAGDNGHIRISWQFLAHHFRHNLPNWKRFDASGGGAIRFYGIHLIALLGECGYDTVASSVSSGPEAGVTARWQASFAGLRLPECAIVVDCHAEQNRFAVEYAKDAMSHYLSDPFDYAGSPLPHDGLDKRVSLLVRQCESLWQDSNEAYRHYANTLQLWAEVERHTQFEVSDAG